MKNRLQEVAYVTSLYIIWQSTISFEYAIAYTAALALEALSVLQKKYNSTFSQI